MDFSSFLNFELVRLGNYVLTTYNLLLAIAASAIWVLVAWVLTRYILPRAYAAQEAPEASRRKINRLVWSMIIIVGIIILIQSLGLDFKIYDAEQEQFSLYVRTIFQGILIFQAARLADWLIYRYVLERFQGQNKKTWRDKVTTPRKKVRPEEQRAGRMIQSIVYVFAAFFLIQLFGLDEQLPYYPIDENRRIVVSNIVLVIIALLFARLIAWLFIQFVLRNYYRLNRVDSGSQYAINQLVRYFIFFLALLIAIQNLSIELTVLWGSIAALLVGLGLGLQTTFNDWVSGIILLFEGAVEVGDIIQLDGKTIGTIRKIGVRTSRVETLENVTIIVPNSQLTNDRVINWSHYDNKIRFVVQLGVAYGSDTKLVKKLLLDAARENEFVLTYPSSFVRFVNFGDSALDFQLHIWAQDFLHIEDIKSDLRFAIDEKFRAHNISIPFPQMDVWVKSEKSEQNNLPPIP